MKNIKGFYMKNFQSHKDTNVVVAPTITTFVGESGKGKTSMFRLLKLVIKNQPKGTDYITAGETKAIGGVILEDDVEVVRERSKSINRYVIHHPDGTSLPLEGFGTEVPPDVLEALDYQPIKIDTDLSIDLNFAEQLEGPFLLGESDASKAKTIDGLAKINVFNIALRNTNKVITSYNLENRNYTKQIEEIDDQLKQYEDLPEMERKLAQLENLLQTIDALEQKKQQYIQLLQRKQEIETTTAVVTEQISKLKNILEVDKYIQQMHFSLQRRNMLVSLQHSYVRVTNEIKDTKVVLEHKSNILQSERLLAALQEQLKKKETYSTLHRQYSEVQQNIARGHAYIERLSPVRNAETIVQSLLALVKKKGELMTIASQYSQNKNQFTAVLQTIDRLKSIRNVEQYIQKMTALLQQKNTLTQAATALHECKTAIQTGLTYKDNMTLKINQNKEEYARLLKQFNKCPVCFGELDETHLHQVIENL